MRYRIHGTNRSKDITLHKSVLNDWFKRVLRNGEESIPLSSAILVSKGDVYANKLPKNSVGTCVLNSNDLQSAVQTSIFSGVVNNTNSVIVNADNFEKAMISVAVRKVITPTWLNDSDQFQIPLIWW